MQHPRPELTKEHIIPDKLGGTLRFERAVCRRCAEHGNKTFEQPALAADFLVPRLLLEIKKRSTRKLPQVAEGDWVMGDIPEELLKYVSLDLYPKILIFRGMPPPGLLVGIDRGDGISAIQIVVTNIAIHFPESKQNHSELTTIQAMTSTAFEVSLAKAAYFYAVAHRGINTFDGDGIRALLKGERSDSSNFVGSPLEKEPDRANDLHRLSLRTRHGSFLTVIVHLFASYGVRPYEVVVGRLLE